MKIDILSLFPSMFTGFLQESIIKRAQEQKKVEIEIHDFRNFSLDPHKKVDDYAFGGGSGMILRPEPIFDCVDSLRREDSYIVLLTPQGKTYDQKKAFAYSKKTHLILICGHYEGFDERIRSLCDEEISIGDYVLTGGEIPSMAITDSVVRLLDGVIKKESYENDSFQNNLLDYPVYTKPIEYRGMRVPEVLLSGHHANIAKFRLEEQRKRTEERRPDLLRKGEED